MSDLWSSVLQRVARRIGARSFRDWFEPTKLHSEDTTEVRVEVPNVLFREWLENNFRHVVEEAVAAEDALRTGPARGDAAAALAARRVRFVVGDEAFAAGDGLAAGEDRAAAPHAASGHPVPSHAAPHQPGAGPLTGELRPPSARPLPAPVGALPRGETIPGGGTPLPGGGVPANGRTQEPTGTPGARGTHGSIGLDERFTFENFVVGACNQFAHAAARAVADAPGTTYNPLYLYGGVGLGKTHLMHAIGLALRARRPSLRIACVSAERFMCEMIEAIRWKQQPEFRDKYRGMDVLLVDDIQFIEGKEATQEEFFHTFRTIYENGKQVVLTSDCPPRELATLEERLRSRFESGLIVDLQVPDLETKLAILRRRAEGAGVDLDDDVALHVARRVRSNVRELEGCLTRLLALASLRHARLDIELAREATRELASVEQKPISVESIQKFVAGYYNVKVSDLKARNNSRSVTFPRQVAMYLCKRLTNSSFPDIGRRFGGKHHSTVIHSVNKIRAEAERSEEFEHLLKHFVDSIN